MSAELQQQQRTSRAAIEAELRQAGAAIKGTVVKCPFHDDRSPSGSIFCNEQGVWRFRCHTATCGFHGDVFDIRARAAGRDVGDVLIEARSGEQNVDREEARRAKPQRVFANVDAIVASVSRMGPVEATYIYTHPESGAAEIVVVRYRDGEGGKKKFLPHRADRGGFVLGAPPKPWPIYNRRRVLAADEVVVVEGEKCVHALHKLGIVATTSLSGAENADKADWSPLNGKKKVYLWRDFDEAGTKYINAAAEKIFALPNPPAVELFDPTGLGLPEGGDVDDFIQMGATAEEVWRVLRDGSESIGPGAELINRLGEIIDGTWKSIEWPWRSLSRSSKALFPGTITVICGDPNASKSFFMLQAMEHWHRSGVPVDLLELEDDRAFHLHRLLAVLSGRWDVLDDDWCRENQRELLELHAQHAQAIQSFAPHLQFMPLGEITYKTVLAWIEQRCAAGAKILAIDPITAIATNDSRYIEDLTFIVKASRLLREHQARLIVVTHPREGFSNKRATADSIAGGRAFSRHPQTVLLLHRHDPATDLVCMTSLGNAPYPCNRTVRIAKARNAPGHGWRVGFSLGADVRFHEHGVVVEKPKKQKQTEEEVSGEQA